jgi:hypothetical protein
MSKRYTKAELLEVIDKSRKNLDQTINALSEEELSRPNPPDGWSVKDHVAHLAAWMSGTAALLRGDKRTTAMGLSDDVMPEKLSTDEVNKHLYEQSKNQPWAQVHATLESAHQALLKVLAPLTDDDLYKPIDQFRPGQPVKDGSKPIMNWIEGDSFAHFDEHVGWIKEQIAAAKKSR